MCERSKFKQEITFERRQELSKMITEKYHGKFPIIAEPYKSTDPILTRKKFLASPYTSMHKMIIEIRKNMQQLDSNTNLCFYVIGKDDNINTGISNNMILLSLSTNIGGLYDQYKDEDGFLYIIYTIENVFG